jgi:WD40 repeat protein
VRVWDLKAGKQLGEPLPVPSRRMGIIDLTYGDLAVAVGELDGRTVIVSASSDMTVRVWDLAGPQLLSIILDSEVTALAARRGAG